MSAIECNTQFITYHPYIRTVIIRQYISDVNLISLDILSQFL